MEECGHVYVWDISDYGVEDTECECPRGHEGPHANGVGTWWDDTGNRVEAPN